MVSFGNASGPVDAVQPRRPRAEGLALRHAADARHLHRQARGAAGGREGALRPSSSPGASRSIRASLRPQGRGAGPPRPRGPQDDRFHDPGAVNPRRARRAAVAAHRGPRPGGARRRPPRRRRWASSPERGRPTLGFAGGTLRAGRLAAQLGLVHGAAGGRGAPRRAHRLRRATPARRLGGPRGRRRGDASRARSSRARPATSTSSSRAGRWASWTTPSSRSVAAAGVIHVKSAARLGHPRLLRQPRPRGGDPRGASRPGRLSAPRRRPRARQRRPPPTAV